MTAREWLKSEETKWDKYNYRRKLNAILLRSLYILHDSAAADRDELIAKLEDAGLGAVARNGDKALSAITSRLIRFEKDAQRIRNCQTRWIGFEATCCTSTLAVPIGCNHRLCNICNAHRAEHYRECVRVMFDRLEHPIFLTLTIPNVRKISKRTYTKVRFAIRKLLKQHNGWMKGGLYSLETTYNRKPGTQARWHVHAHVLIDSKHGLPRSRPEFIRFKRCLEFDWLIATGGRKTGWHPSDRNYWLHKTELSRSTRGDFGGSKDRRIVDVRPVRNREKAAYEVLKYITKCADFADYPEAVEQFLTASRGTRMIQTFGTWYGFKFPDKVQTWSHLKCECGENKFIKIGELCAPNVWMDEHGRWHLRPQQKPSMEAST